MASSLKKNIGFYGLISLGAGGVIGSSWIYTNSQFFKAYGAGGEIFGLMIAAVLAVMVSLSFAELSTIFTKSGGEVVYAYAAFGKKGALFAGWALIGSYLSILAFFCNRFKFADFLSFSTDFNRALLHICRCQSSLFGIDHRYRYYSIYFYR